MKKSTKFLTVVMAVSVAAAAVSACSSKKDEDVDGKYTAEYDMSGSLLSGMGLDIDTEEGAYFHVELELEDGKYTLYSDGSENYNAVVEYMLSDEVKSGIVEMMGASDMSAEDLDTLAQQQGYDTYDAYLEAMLSNLMSAEDLEMSEEGIYEIDDDKITFTPDDGGDIGEGIFDDGTITMDFEDGETVEFSK